MWRAAPAPTVAAVDTNPGFSNTQLFATDARVAFGVLNHLRYQALHHFLGLSRPQANVLTAVALLSTADAAYESARRLTGIRPRVAGSDAALGVLAVREVGLGFAGPGVRRIPGLGVLLVIAMAGAVAVPRLRRVGRSARAGQQALRAAEQRMRRERAERYAAARERARAAAA